MSSEPSVRSPGNDHRHTEGLLRLTVVLWKAEPKLGDVSESDEYSADGETVPLLIRNMSGSLDAIVGEYSPKCVEEIIDLTRIFRHQ